MSTNEQLSFEFFSRSGSQYNRLLSPLELAVCSRSSSSTASTRVDPATSVLESDKFGEPEIKELVGFGFTREQVIAELRRFNGDKRQATAALFAKSLKF